MNDLRFGTSTTPPADLVIWACPACNRSNVVQKANDTATSWQYVCRTCGVRGPIRKTEHQAALAWNKLSQDVALARE